MSGPAPRPAPRRTWVGLLLGAWFACLVLVGAGLMARHTVALPSPSSVALARRLAPLRPRPGHNLAVHLLSADCRCSQRIAEHLAHSVRPQDWDEVVVWVRGEDTPAPLPASFHARVIASEELEKYGVEAVPALVAISADDRVLYSGGYTDRKQGPDIRDVAILDSLSASREVASLPVFGCAASQRLKSALGRLPAF